MEGLRARFPDWMWHNPVIEELAEKTRSHNLWRKDHKLPPVNLLGLDIYSLFRSADVVLSCLAKVDPEAREIAAARFRNLSSFHRKRGEFEYSQALVNHLTKP